VVSLSKSHHIIDPNLGDAEIRDIRFRNPDASIVLKMHNGKECIFEVRRCRLLSVSTEHPQNVVDGVIVCKSVDQMSKSTPANWRQATHSKLLVGSGLILQIEPITGSGLVAVGDDIEIFVERTRVGRIGLS
jgi:hypothetical protein